MTSRAILYLRSSKDRSDVSIDTQRRALHELAVARGLTVVDEFADAVESGKDDDRPAFQRLISSLKDAGRGWDHVLVLDTSRIARRRLLAMMFEADCTKRGVRIIYKSLPESDPATDMVLRSVLQAFDEYHSLISRAKGLAGMAENVRQGWRAGGRAPRGYKLEYHATGAVRDGAPVLKSRLVLDPELAPVVQAYLRLRAQGLSRGVATNRLALPWSTSSTHGMDWQAMTYAGHTVWGMHAERKGGAAIGGEKRRPRSQWQVQRATHEPLITDQEAEAILKQQELAIQGRRVRASPLLLTGLLYTPDGLPWHSDGEGYYRVGKAKRIAAHRIESATLGALLGELMGEQAVDRVMVGLREAATTDQVDGRQLAGMARKISTLDTQIARTVDLAASLPDPAPVLRRVQDLEHQRAELMETLQRLKHAQAHQATASTISAEEVRALLRRLFAEIRESADDQDRRAEARTILSGVLERVELDPANPVLRLHIAVETGDNLASPRVAEQSPGVRWVTGPVALSPRRAA